MKNDQNNPESEQQPPTELEQAVRLADPFGGDVAKFTAAMDNRQKNHQAFLDFVDKHLVEGIDFGKIHRPPRRAQCYDGDACKIESHFTKPSMFKPGAEKVLGWLGATPTWPNLPAYEELALSGEPIQTIILRSEARLSDGTCIGYGFGGRTVEYKEDGAYKDLNRDLKMAKKSAMIDCAITSSRLSEHFTQDVEDMSPGDSEGDGKNKYAKGEQRWLDLKPDDIVPSGKHEGKKVRELPEGYLKNLGEKNPGFRKFCDQELNRRRKGTSGAQTSAGWKVPEIEVFTSKMNANTVLAVITDRYKATTPAKLTRAENEDLLAYLQVERIARDLYNQIPDIARGVILARFGQQAEYRKIDPDQMKELGVVLEYRLRLEAACEQIGDKFGQLLANWENAVGETLDTASSKQYNDLITTLRHNGFEG